MERTSLPLRPPSFPGLRQCLGTRTASTLSRGPRSLLDMVSLIGDGGGLSALTSLLHLGFYPLALAMLSFLFLLCSLRTNLVFVLVFICATLGFSFAAAGLWYTALGSTATGTTFVVATGACFFAADVLGW